MAECDVLLLAQRVLTPAGDGPGAVAVRDGRICFVGPAAMAPVARRTVTLAADEALLPGLVDPHVHLQVPGRAGWEGADSGTRAAVLGGVTTLVDMPLDGLPVTVDQASLAAKRAALQGVCEVDVGLWGGAVPGLAGLDPLLQGGVLGFKAFLSPSGCPQFPPLGPADLRSALERLRPSGVPLLVHAEDHSLVHPLPGPTRDYASFLDSRPAAVETSAVAAVIAALADTGGWAHLVHLSCAGSVELVRSAQQAGLHLSAETCPHYLTVDVEQVPAGATQTMAWPAVRGRVDAEALWAALASGVLAMVASDHSPCAPGGKATGDFALDTPGVASLQLRLPVVWTEARRRGIPLAQVVRWLAEAPAELAGLADKGRIAVGADADFCLFAPDAPLQVGALAHRQSGSPYDGQHLVGVVRDTWLRGAPCRVGQPRGQVLSR